MDSSTSVAFGLKEVNTYRVTCTSLQLSATPACQSDGNSSKKRKNACTKGGISLGLQAKGNVHVRLTVGWDQTKRSSAESSDDENHSSVLLETTLMQY